MRKRSSERSTDGANSGRESDFAAVPSGTTKTAIAGYLSGLAFQRAGRGVRAGVVCPGDTSSSADYDVIALFVQAGRGNRGAGATERSWR